MKTLTLLTVLLSATFAFAQNAEPAKRNLRKDFETLGDNKAVVERVRNLDTQQKVRIVQNRLVDRNNRVELGLNYAFINGGDSYVQTQNFGGGLEYHINPRWSLGVHYQRAYNSLTAEGDQQFRLAREAQALDSASSHKFPAVDYPLNSTLATASFYPIYGKLNLFDAAVAHFDIYMLLGYGRITVLTGSTNLYAAGIGAGVWMSSRITTRLEMRYQTYQDLLLTDRRQQNQFQALASVGILVW